MLDTIDQGLISLLQEDGRMTYANIAKKLGASESTVRRKLRQLVKDGCVSIVCMPEPKKVGLSTIAFIRLEVELSRCSSIYRELSKRPEIQHIASCTGAFPILMLVTLPSLLELSSFLYGELAQIKGIRRSEVMAVLEVYKRTPGPIPRVVKTARRRRSRQLVHTN